MHAPDNFLMKRSDQFSLNPFTETYIGEYAGKLESSDSHHLILSSKLLPGRSIIGYLSHYCNSAFKTAII